MSASVIQHKAVTNTNALGTIAITMDTQVSVGSLIVVGAINYGTCVTAPYALISGIADGGNTYVQGPGCLAHRFDITLSDIWYCAQASTITSTITVTFAKSALGDNFTKEAFVWEVGGLGSTANFGQGVRRNENIANPQIGNPITIPATTQAFIAAIVSPDVHLTITANPTAANPFTSGGDITSGTLNTAHCGSGYHPYAAGQSLLVTTVGATAYTPSWTASGNNYYAVSSAAFYITDTPPVPPPGPGTTRYIRTQRDFPLAFDNSLLITISRLEFIIQSGVGLSTGQGSDPVAMVQISKDGGETWGNERWLPMGKIGEYFRRCYGMRWGQGRNWYGRIVTTDPVFTDLISCVIDGSVGTS